MCLIICEKTDFSKIFERNGSLFFSRAFVTFVGKEPEDKDTPMMEKVSGPTMSENTSLRNVVAIMSNWQVDDVRRWVISSKFDRKMSSK